MTHLSASLAGFGARFKRLGKNRYRIRLLEVSDQALIRSDPPGLVNHTIPVGRFSRVLGAPDPSAGQKASLIVQGMGGDRHRLLLVPSRAHWNDDRQALTFRARMLPAARRDLLTGESIRDLRTSSGEGFQVFSDVRLAIPDWRPSFFAPVAASFQDVLDATRVELGFPGAIAAVSSPVGSWMGVTGLAGADLDRAPRPVDYSRIGSVTKTFTVMALLRQVDRGRVSLDDPIEKYVPGLPNGKAITLRMLAEMRSGLSDYSQSPRWQGDYLADPFASFTPEQLIDYVRGERPLFAAGSEYAYSNTNTVLLGMVIEQVAGRSLRRVFKEDLFEPLNLQRTIDPGESARFPDPHLEGITAKQTGSAGDATRWNPSWASAAGRLISTIGDLSIWGRVLGTGGGLISRRLQRERIRSVRPLPEEGFVYGLGFYNQNGWLGHNGSVPGYTTYVGYEPASQTVVAVMANSDIYEQASPADLVAARLQELAPMA